VFDFKYDGPGIAKGGSGVLKVDGQDVATLQIPKTGDHLMGQNHFMLRFPLKTPADATALAAQLPPLMPGLIRAADAIATIHSSRFTILDEKTLLFLAEFRQRIR
jgi:hypothetical protein